MSKKMLKSLKSLKAEEIVICVLLVILVVLVVYYIYQNNSSEGFESKDETVVYFFYVDWCGYCKQAKPEIAKLEEKINNNKMNNVKLVRVNCDEEEEMASKYGVKGYPTIVCEKNGDKNTFNSKVDADDIQKWVESL